MANDRRRFKIYRDEAKERHTNHWDWDYMGYEGASEAYRQHSLPVRCDEAESDAASPDRWLSSALYRVLFLFRG